MTLVKILALVTLLMLAVYMIKRSEKADSNTGGTSFIPMLFAITATAIIVIIVWLGAQWWLPNP